MAEDRIQLIGIKAIGHHGVLERERRDGQEFVVDVTLYLDTSEAAISDDLADTVDYGGIAAQVASVLTGPPVGLLETLAERIAALALAPLQVDAVDVVVHKPQAPLSVAFGDIRVEIHRSRTYPPALEVAQVLAALAPPRPPQPILGARVLPPVEVPPGVLSSGPVGAPPVPPPPVVAPVPVPLPAGGTPEIALPVASEPEADEPYVPVFALEPEAGASPEPGAVEPEAVAAESEVGEPEAVAPEAVEPEPEPEAAEPEAVEPEVVEPEAGEPVAFEPEAAQPEAFEPDVAPEALPEPAAEAVEPEADPTATQVLPVADWSEPDEQPLELVADDQPVDEADAAPAPASFDDILGEDVPGDEAPTAGDAAPLGDADVPAVPLWHPIASVPAPGPVDEPPAVPTPPAGVPAVDVEPTSDEASWGEPVVPVEIGLPPVPPPPPVDPFAAAPAPVGVVLPPPPPAPEPEPEPVLGPLPAPEPLLPPEPVLEPLPAPEPLLPPEPVAIPEPLPAPEPVAVPEPAADWDDVADRALDQEPESPVAVVLALGSNVGPSQEILRHAVADLAGVPGLEVTEVAPLARTAAVGGPEQPDFLNTVVLARTTLSPRALLAACQAIEASHGRVRGEAWGPRTLDIDLIVHGSTIASADDLELPHPRASQRAFVLQPWAQVDPTAVLPGLGGGPVAALATTAPDRDGIRWMALDWWTAPGD